jgi:hypothetical protein
MKTALITILILLIFSTFSYFITAGLIKLITLCFGWEFSWLVATGIWLIMWLVSLFFKK